MSSETKAITGVVDMKITAGGLAAWQACVCNAPAPTPQSIRPRCKWRDGPVRRTDFYAPDRMIPISVTGAHGGAGTTTVARLLHARDTGTRWPQFGEEGVPPRVLLVARTHATGLTAVSQALARYCAAGQGPSLAGIVLVPDTPGRLPKPLKRRIALLESAAMVHRLPWVSGWRLTETAHDPRIAEELRAFAERAALTRTPAIQKGVQPCNG
jgi:hypothetical protein